MRSTFLVKNFGKLESISGPESLFDPAYSGNHIVIFECQLKTPSQMNLIDTGDLDFFKLQKLSMANWRIVDVDHFMRGNSFFNKHMTELDWHKDVESKIGSNDKRVVTIKEIEATNNAMEMADIYRKYIDIKEPRSNRGIEVFKTKEEIDAEKKEAVEKAQQKSQQKKQEQAESTASPANEATEKQAEGGDKASKKADKKAKQEKKPQEPEGA